jgi:hypothetical protein
VAALVLGLAAPAGAAENSTSKAGYGFGGDVSFLAAHYVLPEATCPATGLFDIRVSKANAAADMLLECNGATPYYASQVTVGRGGAAGKEIIASPGDSITVSIRTPSPETTASVTDHTTGETDTATVVDAEGAGEGFLGILSAGAPTPFTKVHWTSVKVDDGGLASVSPTAFDVVQLSPYEKLIDTSPIQGDGGFRLTYK